MSVNPGFGGQKFIPQTLFKVRKLRNLLEEAGRTDILIEMDGGINKNNINEISKEGVNIFVAGSAVFKGDIEKNIKILKENMGI